MGFAVGSREAYSCARERLPHMIAIIHQKEARVQADDPTNPNYYVHMTTRRMDMAVSGLLILYLMGRLSSEVT